MATVVLSPAGSAQAVLQAQNGTTFELHAGTYPAITVDNTDLTLEPYGDGPVVISGGSASAALFVQPTGDRLTVEDLEIKGGHYTVKAESTRTQNTQNADGATGLTLLRCKIHDSDTHVLKLSPDCDDMTIEDCEIYNSGRADPNQGQGVDAVNIDRLLFEDNYIHDTTQNAIFVKGGSTGCVIRNNTVKGAGFSGIILGQDTDLQWFDVNQNPGLYESLNCTAFGNTVINCMTSGLSSWSSLNPDFENNTVRNCGSGQGGLWWSKNARSKTSSGGTVFHNVFWIPSGHYVVNSGNWSGSPPSTTHNLFSTSQLPLYADLTDDWVRNIDDYTLIDNQIPNGNTGAWWKADANLDGLVNVDDYTVLDSGVIPVFP